MRRTLLACVGLFLAAPGLAAQDPGVRPPTPAPVAAAPTASLRAGTPTQITAHRTGSFNAVMPVRSPESSATRWAELFQFDRDLTSWDYDLETESFSLYVPADYDPDGEPYDVLVWISPFDDGAIPEQLKTLMDERRLIWISPNAAGNPRHLFPRSGLTLDAAANVAEYYNVDPERIFVSGLSGGGRMASLLAIDYPDVFAGAFPIIGVTSYMQIRLESTPGLFVPFFPPPPERSLDRAKRQPFVVMTGENDYNREECRLTAEAHERDGFTNLHYIEIEGMGHEMPSPESFARGLDLLLGSRRPD